MTVAYEFANKDTYPVNIDRHIIQVQILYLNLTLFVYIV